MEKIPIAMATYNRPQYLSQVLHHLKNNENLDKFFILTSEEPNCKDVSKLIENIDFIEVRRNINLEHLGCNKNIINAINLAFKQYDKIVVLEDDTIPGKDFLNFFLWGFYNIKEEHGIHSLGAYNNCIQIPLSIKYDKIKYRNWFCPWAWGIWKYCWEQFDYSRCLESQKISWDIYLLNEYKKRGWLQLYPLVGRCNNIGEVGTHVPSKSWHQDNQFCPVWVETIQHNPIKNFILQNDELLKYKRLNDIVKNT